jgi:uncharacterized protein (PEP-CTERM system associated)
MSSKPRSLPERLAPDLLKAVCSAAFLLGGGAQAQNRSGALVIQPSLSISQSFTDNRDLSVSDKKFDGVTQVSPGVRIASRSGPVQGTLDYALNAQLHSNPGGGASSNGFTNSLAAAFNAEAIERHALVDVRASITQQNISAFGVQSNTGNLTDRNRTEVRSLSVSPVLRGNIGTFAEVEGRMSWMRTSGVASGAASNSGVTRSLRASGNAGSFGWSADVTDSTSDFEGGRESSSRQTSLSLSYRPDVDLTLNVQGGSETDTVRSLDSQSTTNYGGGFTWTPTQRSVITGQVSKRYFGTGHSFSLSHRLVQSVVRFSSSRDANNFGRDSRLEYANLYDGYFAQLATIIPDPIQRDAVVRALLAEQGGFLARGVTLQNRQDLSVVTHGVRTTLSMTAFTFKTRRLTDIGMATDDFTITGRLRQRGLALNAAYQVSAVANASLAYSVTSTAGNAGLAGTRLRTLGATFSTLMIQRVNLSASLRHTVFDGPILPYTENAGQVTLGFQF